MLDIHTHARGSRVPIRGVEFCRIELAPLADGNVFVSLMATTLDDEEPGLLDQEIASDRVATIDDVLSLIRAHVSIGETPQNPMEYKHG